MLTVLSKSAVYKRVAMSIAMGLKLASFRVIQVLFLDLSNFPAVRKVLIYASPQKSNPFLEFDCVGQLGKMFLLKESKPVDP